jgi:hypothetical protein
MAAERQMEGWLALSRIEQETLKFIIEYTLDDPFRQPPSHTELLKYLNEVLPRRKDDKPALISTEQTFRIATKLRAKGYLVQATGPARVNRNMVLTPEADRFVRELVAQWRANSTPDG